MSDARTLYVGMMDIAPEVEREWNEWYDKVHIPQVMAVPGFLAGRRFVAFQGSPKYMAMYDLADPSVLDGPELQKVRGFGPLASHVSNIRLTVFRQIFPDVGPGFLAQFRRPILYMPFVNIAPEVEEAWNRWYNAKHVPLVATAGLLNGHRYQALSGSWKYMALYEADHENVLDTPEIAKVRGFDEFTPHVIGLERHLYRPL